MSLISLDNVKLAGAMVAICVAAVGLVAWAAVRGSNAEVAVKMASSDHEAIGEVKNSVAALSTKVETKVTELGGKVDGMAASQSLLAGEVSRNAQLAEDRDIKIAAAVDRLSFRLQAAPQRPQVVCPAPGETSTVEAIRTTYHAYPAAPPSPSPRPTPTPTPSPIQVRHQERF
jgi:hypothetical protein